MYAILWIQKFNIYKHIYINLEITNIYPLCTPRRTKYRLNCKNGPT